MLWVLILLHGREQLVESTDLLQDWKTTPHPMLGCNPFLLSACQNFLIYMMFLLVILLTNYGDASRNSRAFLLQSSIKQQLGSNEFLRIKR